MQKAVSLILLAVFIFTSTVSAQKSLPMLRVKRPVAPVESTKFSTISAYSNGDGVWIRWEMASEIENFGFYVYRLDGRGKELVSRSMTPGAAAKVMGKPLYGTEYVLFDPAGTAEAIYQIDTVPLSGTRPLSQATGVKVIKDFRSVGGQYADSLYQKPTAETGRVENRTPLLNKELASEVESLSRPADLSTQRWVASQPGVKLGVKKDGFYRVTRAQLEGAGFDVDSDADLWQLYADGVQQAIKVGLEGEYVEFYGKGIDRIESDTRVYYLVVGPTAGIRMASRFPRPSISTVQARSYEETFVKKERLLYLDSLLNGDENENYFGNVISTTPYTVNFQLSGIDFSDPSILLDVRVQGFSEFEHTVGLVLNGQALATPITGTGRISLLGRYELPSSALVEGTNTLRFTTTSATDFVLFDTVKVSFTRRYQAVANSLTFNSQNYRITNVSGFQTANIRLFDITEEGSPAEIANPSVLSSGDNHVLKIPAARSRLFYAVEDSAILSPASIEVNSPSTLSTAEHSADLVIIAYKDFMVQAEAWAQFRRAQGIDVEVVNVTDIFDEFNYGTLSADSIRDFLAFTKDNWMEAPKYVLLIGDGSYDSRNYQGVGFFNYVPVKIVTTLFSEAASDDALADFDGDGLAEMAIGRIPARTSQVVTDYMARVINFEQPAYQDLNRGALFAYDVDPNFDFGGMSNRVAARLPAEVPKAFVSRTATNSEALLVGEINTGKYIVNYSGHGSVGVWQSTNFFSGLNVNSCSGTHPCLTNANNRSIFTALTCLNGFFHNLTIDSLSERLLKAPNGGAIVVWASSGQTTADLQEIMALRFFQKLGGKTIPRMGDLVLDAKSVLPGASDVRLSWVLLGDPMLKVHP